ncbi:hypothetical protein KC333_g62 [Hortaea werneckii]|nr:hypothetical protein KC333_g62 [Hortaea werneckii]
MRHRRLSILEAVRDPGLEPRWRRLSEGDVSVRIRLNYVEIRKAYSPSSLSITLQALLLITCRSLVQIPYRSWRRRALQSWLRRAESFVFVCVSAEHKHFLKCIPSSCDTVQETSFEVQ